MEMPKFYLSKRLVACRDVVAWREAAVLMIGATAQCVGMSRKVASLDLEGCDPEIEERLFRTLDGIMGEREDWGDDEDSATRITDSVQKYLIEITVDAAATQYARSELE